MNHHQAFKAHLDTLPHGVDILRVCKSYKTAEDDYAFELNGRLEAGLPLERFFSDLPHLKKLIGATPTDTITLFRMTSEAEFSVPLLQALEGTFTYQAFMSTTSDINELGKFIPLSGAPLILEIECPPGMAFAPIDFISGIKEGEYLLGCGTKFRMTSDPQALSVEQAKEYASGRSDLRLIKLKVVENPPYIEPDSLLQISV